MENVEKSFNRMLIFIIACLALLGVSKLVSYYKQAHLPEAETGVSNGHEWVDLRLPSGTLWAKINIGAQSMAQPGEHLPWGDAAPLWGDEWSMPSAEQWAELIDPKNCTLEWAEIDGMPGYVVNSKRCKGAIFLPAAGRAVPEIAPGISFGGNSDDYEGEGWYWSSTPDEYGFNTQCFSFCKLRLTKETRHLNPYLHYMTDSPVEYGLSVRLVRK